jgi:pimeloyl-ACP methyl ester carboxylesterase
VTKLVLLASALPGTAGQPPKLVSKLLFGDPFFWLVAHLGSSVSARLLGMPGDFRPTLDERKTIATTWESFFPIAPRKQGVLFDQYVSNPDVQNYCLEDISVPTLVISARDDAMVAYANAEAAAARIPGARLLTFERGGHLLLGVEETIQQRVTAFVTDPAALA